LLVCVRRLLATPFSQLCAATTLSDTLKELWDEICMLVSDFVDDPRCVAIGWHCILLAAASYRAWALGVAAGRPQL